MHRIRHHWFDRAPKLIHLVNHMEPSKSAALVYAKVRYLATGEGQEVKLEFPERLVEWAPEAES